MKKLGAMDVAFLDVERPNTPPLVGVMIVLDPATAPDHFVRHLDILDYVERRLHLAPNLRKRLVYNPLRIDEPRLVDDPDFDLEFHVRHLALPRPRDRRQLAILNARLMSRPMDLQRPLWELYVIEGLEEMPEYPKDAFAIVIKLHHAAFDGAAGMASIWALMQDAPDAEPPPPTEAWQPQRKPNIADWTISSMIEGAQQLANNLAALPQLGERAWKGFQAQRESSIPLKPAPKTRFANASSSHRVFDWLDMPKPEISAIRAALGKPKMNDLALTIIAGGLRRYLQAKDELPDKPLIALCPINVRGSGDPLEGGNQVTSMRVPLGTDIADPLERLKAITAASTEGKHQAEELGATFLPDLMALYPYPIRSALLRGATALAEKRGSPVAMANVVVSNMPPPTGDWYFAGSKFLAWAGNGMLTPGLGLFLIVAGIRTDLSISVTSTRDVLPDPAFFVECLRDSYHEVRDVAGVKAD